MYGDEYLTRIFEHRESSYTDLEKKNKGAISEELKKDMIFDQLD